MRKLIWIFLLPMIVRAAGSAQQIATSDAARIHEFYRLAAQIQDRLWPNWSQVPAPLLLVTNEGEFLTHHAAPSNDFKKISDEFYLRPRTFPTHLLATFPAFGPPSVIVIGRPEDTSAKSSTPWLMVVMHEHFHQLQNAQPEYFEGVEKLGLTRGDKTGMWMLNYPFPYSDPKIVQSFDHVRRLLLEALAQFDSSAQLDRRAPAEHVAMYVEARKEFFSQLSTDDHKYLAFQLWQEGIARYTQVKAAETAADYRPSPEYAALPDFESFAAYASRARRETLDELRRADISKDKREVVYSWGSAEGFLLDRVKPNWRDEYLLHPFSLDSYFK